MSNALFSPTKHAEHCPQCGAVLQLKQGKKGLFLGCSAYPACDYLKPLQPQHDSNILKTLEQACPDCGRPLVLRQGSFGMFIGCSGYPHCHFIAQDTPQEEENPVPCPQCRQGNLVPRRGRQGKIFYGCDHYPKCKFTLPAKPYAVRCPQCQGLVCIMKNGQYHCVDKHCKHVFEYHD